MACKTRKFYILLAFSLITTALLIVLSIYCYLIKDWVKQKHLLPFHVTNYEFKEITYNKINQKWNNKVKDKSIKNHTYYFFNYTINIPNFDPNNIKIHEKSYKNILIYYTEYVRIKIQNTLKLIV